MKLVVLAVCLTTLALAGCRRETPYYEPMKLGGEAPAESVQIR